ncbi:MAG: hypothetical protein MUC62_10060 [Candidatus Thermoplasmatota archaeon]|jgi:hypothetical protein|nr:hypothetical protein [Candidatus Thermoplasmatota archaeon]
MEATMGLGTVFARIGGIISSLAGILLITISAGAFGTAVDPGERALEMVGRAGFAFLLMGLFTVFLFSFRSVPEELTLAFVRTSDTNTGRLLDALNLDGKGTYMPPGGRLLEDRVYVPMEKVHFPLPNLSDQTVFNVGTTGPSMGISMVPPGKDLVDLVEEGTGKRFSDDGPSSAQEALERLGKGTGLYKGITVRGRGDGLDVTIAHSRLKGACSRAWKEHPNLHERVGCVGCSAVLCALARVHRRPLRIISASDGKDGTVYELGRD